MTKENNKTKCGFIAILGASNSGKSTFLNTILNEKIAIVTHKVQTTRGQIRGIKTDDNSQIIFIDTPGIFNAKEKFGRAMVSSAWSAMDNSDAVIYILDVTKGITKTFTSIINHLKTINTPIALVLNKIDLIEKNKLLSLTDEIIKIVPDLFNEIFMISALKNDGLNAVLEWIKQKIPYGDFVYEKNITTDIPLEIQLAEITREKIYELLHQELPYNIAVKTIDIKKDAKGKATIVSQEIYTNSVNHVSIIVGNKGKKLKEIGIKARKDMEKIIGNKVCLFTKVNVNENWKQQQDFYDNIGLIFKN